MNALIVNKYSFWRTIEKGVSFSDLELRKNSKRFGIWFYSSEGVPLFPKNTGAVENLQK